MSRRSPRVKARATAPRLNDVGTLNPVALDSSMFQHQSLYPTFDEVSELSTRASDLKSEIARLRRELDSLTTSESQTKFTKFQKTEMDFEKKLQERDQELDNFAKFLTVYRVDSNPTFVEVEALQSKRHGPIFDAINASLLVSNPQRGFFRKNDIEFQNEELKGIIGEQEKVLRLLEARLKLFSSFQSANTAQFTVESLRRGMTPTVLGGSTPTKFDEMSTKHRALSNELAALVRERKSLTQKRVAAKLVRRRRRERVRMTLSAQNSARFETPISQAREGEKDADSITEQVLDDEKSAVVQSNGDEQTDEMERPSCENGGTDVIADDCGCKGAAAENTARGDGLQETNEENPEECRGDIEKGDEGNQVCECQGDKSECSNSADIDDEKVEQGKPSDELHPDVDTRATEPMEDRASHSNETNDNDSACHGEGLHGNGEESNQAGKEACDCSDKEADEERTNELPRNMVETNELTGEVTECAGEASETIEEAPPATEDAHELAEDVNNSPHEPTDVIEEAPPQESTEVVPEVHEFREDAVGST